MRDIDKFRGCLMGGAAGDALGYAIEFLSESRIFDKYGENGITKYSLRNRIAEISDDTQMTLFTAEGLIVAARHCKERTRMRIAYYIRQMYRYWYKTQIEKYSLHKSENRLLNVPELFSPRAPGMTCLSAIKEGANGTIENPINDSKGCGGVMRVAPIGLCFCDIDAYDYDFSDGLGAAAAAMTHGHELGYIPAAALVHIVRKVSEKETITLKEAVNDSISAMKKKFSNAHYINDFAQLMNKALELAESDIDDLDAIHQLGEGWVAEETLAIAVYCALKYEDDFDKAIIASVNHNGDSDSTGAIAGNILGAYIGYNKIPLKYKEHLELHELILVIADDLYKAFCEK